MEQFSDLKDWINEQGYRLKSGLDYIKIQKKNPSRILIGSISLFTSFFFLVLGGIPSGTILAGVFLLFGIAAISVQPGSKKYYIRPLRANESGHFVADTKIEVHHYDVSSYASAMEEGNRDYGAELYLQTAKGRMQIMSFHSRNEDEIKMADQVAELIEKELSRILSNQK